MRERTSYSNFRQTERVSPRHENPLPSSSEFDGHSTRIKQLLRADLMMLEEENSMLKAKCKRVNELEDKVDMILKQNSQLLSQNERLSKLLHQKKQEHEILKDKFESQSSQKLAYATDFEQERRKLINELEQLEGELREIEQVKNAQISELKTQFQLELQTVKRQTVGSHEIYEQEIRKLRDQLDKKDYEVGDAVNRLKRFSSQAEYDILRLKEEKEKLRSQLLYVEADKKKELEAIRSKLEANYLQEVESVKKSHLSSLEGFETENNKLKDLLDNKNIELEQLASRLNKQKNNYEDTIAMTKRENEMLRNKMIEYERLSQSEKDTLKVKLNRVHESEIEEMRINQQKYTDCLQNEIYKLQTALNKKNSEIEQLIKEKTNVRQMFDSEGSRLKEEIDSLVVKIRELQAKQAELVNSYEQKLKEKSKHIDYLDRLNQQQQENNENEIRTIKQLLEHTRRQLDSEIMKKREREQDFQETIEDLKNDNANLKDSLSRERSEREKQVEDLQYQLESQITTLKSKADTLASRNSIVERQLIAIKQTIVFKQKEIRSLQERVRVTEQREKKLQRENDDLRSKLIKKDQKTNQMLNEQKQRLQTTFAFTLDNLRIDHQSALKLEASKHADFNEKLKRKETELDDLLRAYKKMRDGMEALTEQEANKKDMTLKFAGATADLIATKNLFDVFLKTRVLDICSDAREKENYLK